MVSVTELTPVSWFTGLTGVFKGDSVGIMGKDNSAIEVLPIPFRKFKDVHSVSEHPLVPGKWVTIFNIRDQQNPATATPLPQLK
jgi:hypothetical protein